MAVLWSVVLVLALFSLGAFALWPMINPRPTPTATESVRGRCKVLQSPRPEATP